MWGSQNPELIPACSGFGSRRIQLSLACLWISTGGLNIHTLSPLFCLSFPCYICTLEGRNTKCPTQIRLRYRSTAHLRDGRQIVIVLSVYRQCERRSGMLDLDAPSFRALRRMLDFRVRGCELYVVPTRLSEQEGVCASTARRSIDRLVEVALISKIADIEGQSGRSGIYLLHVEKLKVRSELRLSRVERSQDGGVTKITSWRLLMLKEHEASSGEPCVKCGVFPVAGAGFCAHCYVGRYHFGTPARCPVCQTRKSPKHSSTRRCEPSWSV